MFINLDMNYEMSTIDFFTETLILLTDIAGVNGLLIIFLSKISKDKFISDISTILLIYNFPNYSSNILLANRISSSFCMLFYFYTLICCTSSSLFMWFDSDYFYFIYEIGICGSISIFSRMCYCTSNSLILLFY